MFTFNNRTAIDLKDKYQNLLLFEKGNQKKDEEKVICKEKWQKKDKDDEC